MDIIFNNKNLAPLFFNIINQKFKNNAKNQINNNI